ncbi:MAG: hypothetical protein E7031_09810 [Akkermansiaceae bacterium]|nr:hypothetical protein [Akkermansiaceae bacterium]
MKTDWKEFARDMAQLEAEMEAMADSMPDEQVSYTHSSFTRNGKTINRPCGMPQNAETSRTTGRTTDHRDLQERMTMQLERMIQQRTNMLYVLVIISMSLSLLAVVVACLG